MEPKCTRDHGIKPTTSSGKKTGSADIDKIVERLYNTKTKSWEGVSEDEIPKAEDVISKKAQTKDPDAISERLYKTPIKSQNPDPKDEIVAEDIITQKVSPKDADYITERLFTSYTECTDPKAQNDQKICTNSIAKEPVSEEEAKEIFERLIKTHTKSSTGGSECRLWQEIKIQGMGQKMLPIIEGLEKRFAGKNMTEEQCKEIVGRLLKSQTCASQARLDNPRILLYPERTTLMNNVERIRQYQDNGAVAKQTILKRREKWYN